MKIRTLLPRLLAFGALALLVSVAFAAPAKPWLAEYRQILPGQGTGLTIQQMTPTPGTQVFALLDDQGNNNWYVTREGNVLSTGYVSAQHVLAPSSVQSLAAAATLTPPPGTSLVKVAGSGAAVTLSTTTPIAAGTVAGTELVIEGTNSTNTVTIPVNGTTNIRGANAQTTRVLNSGATYTVVWDGSQWVELSYTQ